MNIHAELPEPHEVRARDLGLNFKRWTYDDLYEIGKELYLKNNPESDLEPVIRICEDNLDILYTDAIKHVIILLNVVLDDYNIRLEVGDKNTSDDFLLYVWGDYVENTDKIHQPWVTEEYEKFVCENWLNYGVFDFTTPERWKVYLQKPVKSINVEFRVG